MATASIAFVLGTRPEIIKCAPVIRALLERGAAPAIVHTGQHYARELDAIFFEELELPQPTVHLGVGSMPAAQQLARIVERTAHALETLRPRVVLVQGDTNSVLGGALAAHKMGIPIAHLEAGLRSDDWTMPEEANRVLAGRLAALHFCPTELQAQRLRGEGMTRGIHVVGNTVVDAALQYAELAETRSTVRARLGVEGRRFAAMTLHRPSNVDDPAALAAMLAAVSDVAVRRDLVVVFPVHPRTRATLERARADHLLDARSIVACDPMGYLDFLSLLRHATVALTDSGGVQEEACTLRVPCVTLRPNTERPETVDVGANVLCDSTDSQVLEDHVARMLARPKDWPNPFGDGRTGERVAEVLLDAAR